MEYERTISAFGGSTGLTLPLDLLKFLGLEKGDKIIVQDNEGPDGWYIKVWKKTGVIDDDNSGTVEE